MKVIRIIFYVCISLIIVLCLCVTIWYQTLEKQKKAEAWYALSGPFLQGSTQEQWLLGQAIKADSSFAEAYMQKSISHNKRGDFATGMRLLQKAVDIYPENYLGYRGFVKQYMLHDYEGALEDYFRLDTLTPNFRDAPWGEDIYQVIGLCYQALSDYNSAVAYYDMVIEQDPKWIDSQVYLYRGMVQLELGEYDLAIKDLEIGIQNNPLADYYYFLASSHFQLDDVSKGCEYTVKGAERFVSGYFRSNPYYEVPGQVYLSDFDELIQSYCE